MRPELPVIICTGFSSVLDPQKARVMGIREFLSKPLDKKTMAEKIRAVLDSHPAS